MEDKWKLWAKRVNEWRIIPRLLIGGYGFLVWEVSFWAMGLPEMSGPQSAFVGTIYGSAAGFFAFYCNTGSTSKKD